MTRRVLIINADDFGWTDGHNQAVKEAYQRGVLNRVSLLCNGEAFEEAVALAQQLPRLQVGVHLTLSEGRPLLPAAQLPHLTRGDGKFHDTLKSLLALWWQGRLITKEVQAEWRAQIERALRSDVVVAHLDSHKHVHLLPPLLQALIALAKEYRISTTRLPVEPFSVQVRRRGFAWLMIWMLGWQARGQLRAAGIGFADRFMGFSTSGMMVKDRLLKIIREAPKGVTEIMMHPAIQTPAVEELRRRYAWASRYRFEEELQALCDSEVVELVKAIGTLT